MTTAPGINAPGEMHMGNATECTSVGLGRGDALLVNNETAPPTVTVNGIVIPGSGGGGGPLPFATQVICVRQGGNDTSGTGTLVAPYATIVHAMSTITDALWEKRYMIDLGPGNWADSFTWKAWVFIRGSTSLATRLTGTIDINDPSWGVPGSHSDERSGGQDLQISGTIALDFTLQDSPYGKFYFWNCNLNNTLVMTAQGPVNQVICFGGLWFGGVTTNGGQVVWQGVSGQGGSITLNSSPTTLVFSAYGGGLNGNLVVSYGSGVGVSAQLLDFPINGSVTVSGASAALAATSSSLPPRAAVSVTGGATLTLLSDAAGLGYTPGAPAQWAGSPATTQDAIDRLAAAVYALRGSSPIP